MFVSCVKQDNVLSNNARSYRHLELGKKRKKQRHGQLDKNIE